MVVLKARPNFVGFLKTLDASELRTRNASEQGIDSLGVSLVLGHLKRRGPNGKHLVRLVLGDIPDLGSHTLQEGTHANLPISIVLAGKHRDLTKTHHGRQMVFKPVKVLETSTTLRYKLRDRKGDQRGGEWELIKISFEIDPSAYIPKITTNPQT